MTVSEKTTANTTANSSAGSYRSDEQTNTESARPEEDLVKALQATDLFGTLDASTIQELAAELTVMTLAPEQTLIQQGAMGDSMYVVLDGRLRVLIADESGHAQFRHFMGVGETIGEIALLTGQKRTATIIAEETVKVARLAKVNFEQLTSRSPQIAQALATSITMLIQRRQLRNAIKIAPLFQHMDGALHQALERELELISLRSGERLFRQGDSGDGMYLIVSGRLRVALENEEGTEATQERQLLRTLGRGATLGEIALLTEEPRTATVYAIRDTEVARLSRESYERLVTNFPIPVTRSFTRPITDLVVQRDRPNRPTADTSLSIALIPTAPDVLLPEFTTRLTKAFANLGRTIHLNSHIVDRVLGKEGIAQTTFADNNLDEGAEHDALNVQLVNWLGEQEAANRFLVYEADPTYTPWTRRAIRQADHLLLVGHGTADPQLGEIEVALNRQSDKYVSKGQSLVLLHRGGQVAATGTAHWLSKRQVHNHYHIRWHGMHDDFGRLARTLGGEAVGLVLSGGGARGAAHIGVLQALTEVGIPIDMIGGVSAGSKIGALYAMGYDLTTIRKQFALLSKSVLPFHSVTVPIVSFSTGSTMARQFQRSFGETQIEDLFLPYFCLSANLSRADHHVHQRGDLWQATRASTTVPGMMPPQIHDGDLLIDGGLYNNLPLDVMRARNPKGTIIGVDVMPAVALDNVAPYGASLSGFQALYHLLLPGRNKAGMPHLASLLYRTLEVSSVQRINDHLRAGLADLYLRPPISQFGFDEFGAIDQIIDIGYRYAKGQLANWKSGMSLHED